MLSRKHATDFPKGESQKLLKLILWGMQDNIRALLSTLHTVLWEGSGWNPPQMTDLVEANKVKRQYMKANLIIHPDKVLLHAIIVRSKESRFPG